ncbi:MAG: family 20 glycosylhydrolase [Candidatus Aminicenantales bacterium]
MEARNMKSTAILKRLLGSALAAALILFVPGRAASPKNPSDAPSIIPKPLRLDVKTGVFRLGPATTIIVDSKSEEAAEVGAYLAEKLCRATAFPFDRVTHTGKVPANSILLRTSDDLKKMGPEGYALVSSKSGIKIEAFAAAGLFYGAQTLLQLLPPEVESEAPPDGVDWSIPFVRIEDAPRFVWRGAHLDVGRHFFPKEFIKKYIDLMAMYKLNTFHWHLTEDQGWRIEIKKYPRLTEIGAWRRETMDDATPHGGYYTQEDIREVVAYAKKRFITVVPEIEMPGHCQAALAAYPELSCSGGPFKVGTEWGIIHDVYCAGNDRTFAFLQDVLAEVIDLFPSEYIHIGGDEVPKVRWQNCAKCQERIRAEGLEDEKELQSYFIRRIERYLSSRGKKLVGWDEILEGGLAPNATVMSWRGVSGGIEAAKSGHDVVMTPTAYCYFDYYQGLFDEPRAIGGFLPLDKVYSFEPVPEELSEEEARHVLGGQANVWTEYIKEPRQVEYMLLPRLLALSEVVWSNKDLRSFPDFSRRIVSHYDRLAAGEVNFRLPPPDGLGGKKLISGPVDVQIFAPFPGAEVRFTTDGKEPTTESPLLPAGAVEIKDSAILQARTFLRSGRMSRVIGTIFSRIDPERNGLDYFYYEGDWLRVPDLEGMKPVRAGTVYDVSLEPAGQRAENFALLFNGYLHIQNPGEYTFTLMADDGAVLMIDGREILRHDGLFWILELSSRIRLEAGLHPLRIVYFQKTGARRLDVFCEGPGLEKRALFPHWLFRK